MKKMILFAVVFQLLSLNIPVMAQENKLEVATLGAGCFWCVEAVYERLEGVEKVESGYTGGHVKNPSYREVCDGTTGHAEVCQVYFNPSVITFAEVLDVFFEVHDPTTLNRQGNDVGTQYRSAIYFHNKEQQEIAEAKKKKYNESDLYDKPIVTEITQFDHFYVAEGYHQDYFENNPNQPYCSFVVSPKVKKFEKKFHDKLK